jgi:hypothetical protein
MGIERRRGGGAQLMVVHEGEREEKIWLWFAAWVHAIEEK